jgi:glucose/arabinose dehydrogenase
MVISGLPVSNHDHANNDLAFAHDGRLLISVGSNTNGGLPSPGLGYFPVRLRLSASRRSSLPSPGSSLALIAM